MLVGTTDGGGRFSTSLRARYSRSASTSSGPVYRRKVFPDQYLTTGRLPRATLRASHASECAAQSREPNWSEDARRFPEFPKSCASCLKLIARKTSSWSWVLESTNKTAAGCSVDMMRPIDAPSRTMTPCGEASIRTTTKRKRNFVSM